MPSTTETQGLVIAEAMAAGAHVIAADAPQNRDVLGSAGRIVSPDAGGLCGGAPGRVRGTGGDSGPAREAALRFSLDGQLDRMQLLYESLLETARIA